MNILLFGVPNVGKTTTGKLLADRLGYDFHDIDEEIKQRYNITIEEFVGIGTIEERDEQRGRILCELVKRKNNKVVSVTSISYPDYFKEILKRDDVLAIELKDTVENIYNRLIFSDENDHIYVDDEYKNAHRDYYLSEIYKDRVWYGSVYTIIEAKYDMMGQSPEDVADGIIKKFHL